MTYVSKRTGLFLSFIILASIILARPAGTLVGGSVQAQQANSQPANSQPADSKQTDSSQSDLRQATVPKTGQALKPLAEDEDPALIGKRNLNKGQINFYSLEKEVALGRQLAAELDREAKYITDPLITEYVNRLGQNIVLHSDAKVPFTIKVVDSEEVNAFALPGGFFYVNKGLLLEADNEAEVVGVMAHEIAHVAARHGVEQASKGTLVNYASIPLIFLGGWGGYAIQQAASLAVPLGFLKFSRGAEEEADRLGAQYMWAAGYDPQALLSFFEKLQAKDKKKPGTLSKLFSTHPATGDRIKKVSALVERFPERAEYAVSSSEFNQIKQRLISQTNAQRAVLAEKEAQRPTLKRRPSSAPADTATEEGESGAAGNKRPTLKRAGSDNLAPNAEQLLLPWSQ
jgi:predicted Zn-dependent protease